LQITRTSNWELCEERGRGEKAGGEMGQMKEEKGTVQRREIKILPSYMVI